MVDTATGDGVFGRLLVSVIPVDAPETEAIGRTEVDDGTFGLEIPHDLSGVLRVQAHYLGQFGVAPCESRTIEVER